MPLIHQRSTAAGGLFLLAAALLIVSSAHADPGGLKLAARAERVDKLVARLQPTTSPTLEVSRELEGRRASLFLVNAESGEARERLAELLGYHWAEAGEGRLRLEQSPERRRLPAKVRAERVRQAQDYLAERLRVSQRYLNGDEAARESLTRPTDVVFRPEGTGRTVLLLAVGPARRAPGTHAGRRGRLGAHHRGADSGAGGRAAHPPAD
jgi:hypothetical protein